MDFITELRTVSDEGAHLGTLDLLDEAADRIETLQSCLADAVNRMSNILTEEQLDAAFPDGQTIRQKVLEYRRVASRK